MFAFDVETLSTESTAVVLSAALIHFDETQPQVYQDLLDKALFVKFDAAEQIRQYKRAVDKDTMNWWQGQSDKVKNKSLKPSDSDVSMSEGLDLLDAYYKKYAGDKLEIVWQRGSLDQVTVESMYRMLDRKPFVRYNKWRDVRTYIDVVAPKSSDGYTKVYQRGFVESRDVIKHDPVHDCALDIMQICHNNPENEEAF